MKKLLCALLAAVMLLGCMAAFAEDSKTINMFISGPEYQDAIRELIDAYLADHPDVTINYETTQNDYPTLLKTKLNAGECPDIFSSTSGKEIAVYQDYSYNFAGTPAADALNDAVRSVMSIGDEVLGFHYVGNFFGLVYNKAIFEEVGVEFPQTLDEFEAACEAIQAAGYQPVSTGFAEWWVFKHIFQHFLNAASDDTADLVAKFQAGEAKMADYPALYDNFFRFIDLAVKYSDSKPLETDLAGEESALGTGKAAMILGQGAWVESDLLNIDPELQIGFNGYPVTDDPADCKVITGSDQALRIYKDSPALDTVMDFVNFWMTSDYAKTWFCDVCNVVPTVKDAKVPATAVATQGNALVEEKGSGSLAICYSTDSFHQAFGEIMQAYIGGTLTKDEACAQIEQKWHELEG